MRLAHLPVLVAILALVLLLVSGPGARLELWHFRTGFTLMRWATFLGLGAAALAALLLLISRTRRGHAMTLIFGTVLGLVAAAPPLLGGALAALVSRYLYPGEAVARKWSQSGCCR